MHRRPTHRWIAKVVLAALTWPLAARAEPYTANATNSPTASPSFSEDVLDTLRADLIANPNDADLYMRAALVLHKAGRPRAAADLYARAVALEPKNARLRYLLAHAYALAGDPRALAEATESVRADDTLTQAHALRGILLRRQGQIDEALASLEKAWNASPPSVAAGMELARRELQRNQPEAAARILEVCAIHDPRNVQLRATLASAHEEAGRIRDARRTWKSLVDEGNGGALALAKLHELSLAVGDADQAHRYLNAAKRIDPFLQVHQSASREATSLDSKGLEFPPLRTERR